MKVGRKWKDNENSRILVQIEDDRFIDEEGRPTIKAHWEELKSPLNLGSVKEPLNTKVIRIKIEVGDDLDNDDNPISNIFKNLFK